MISYIEVSKYIFSISHNPSPWEQDSLAKLNDKIIAAMKKKNSEYILYNKLC